MHSTSDLKPNSESDQSVLFYFSQCSYTGTSITAKNKDKNAGHKEERRDRTTMYTSMRKEIGVHKNIYVKKAPKNNNINKMSINK